MEGKADLSQRLSVSKSDHDSLEAHASSMVIVWPVIVVLVIVYTIVSIVGIVAAIGAVAFLCSSALIITTVTIDTVSVGIIRLPGVIRLILIRLWYLLSRLQHLLVSLEEAACLKRGPSGASR